MEGEEDVEEVSVSLVAMSRLFFSFLLDCLACLFLPISTPHTNTTHLFLFLICFSPLAGYSYLLFPFDIYLFSLF